MTPEEHLRAGHIDEALAALRDAVRKSPADGKLRIFLFQLLSVLGQWEKALTQLQVVAEMDADSMLMAQIYTPVLHAEAFRTEVFAGRRSPLIFGDPEEWIGLLVEANRLLAEGQAAASGDLRQRAFEAAPALPGTINGESFDWIADADSRLGPVVEAIIDGKYYWVPFARIHQLTIEAPSDLRNLVWAVTHFTWTNGGHTPGFIPTRYAGTEAAADSRLRLAKITEWNEGGSDLFLGLGQRVFATQEGEYPLLDVRMIELSPVPAAV